jgi:hypothetical protein
MKEIKQFPYTPQLGWSVSRYEIFSICKRRYFYQYYGKYDPEFMETTINKFKSLVSIPLETGAITHEMIEVLLRRLQGTPEKINTKKFLNYSRRIILNRLENKQFEEVVYGLTDELTLDDFYPKVAECLQNLLNSARFEWIYKELLSCADEWVIEPLGYGEVRIDGMKAFCKVDFLFPFENEFHILDWKTGKLSPAKNQKQLLGYSTWTAFHYEVPANRVVPTIAYLYPEYKEIQKIFTDENLENFAIQIRAELKEMQSYCRDIENNIPQDKSAFPKANNERICRYCKFRGLCFPEEYVVDL